MSNPLHTTPQEAENIERPQAERSRIRPEPDKYNGCASLHEADAVQVRKIMTRNGYKSMK